MLLTLEWCQGYKTSSYCTSVTRLFPPQTRHRFLSFLVSVCSTPIGVAYALRLIDPKWDAAELLERDALSQVRLFISIW